MDIDFEPEDKAFRDDVRSFIRKLSAAFGWG